MQATPIEKSAITDAVNSFWGNNNKADPQGDIRIADQLNAQLDAMDRWSDSSWGFVGPAYETWQSLRNKVDEFKVAAGVTAGLLHPNPGSPTEAFAGSLRDDAKVAIDKATTYGPWVLVGIVAFVILLKVKL